MFSFIKVLISQHRLNMLKHDAGVVVLLYGLAIIPIFAMLGLAIDVGRIYYVDSIISGAADQAAIAGAKAGGTNANITQNATAIFNANIPPNFVATITGLTVQITNGTTGQVVTVSATGSIPTTFMQLLGYPNIAATSESAALISPPAEIVLALDNTGSMYGAPMQAEINAATLFLTTVYGGASTGSGSANDTVPNLFVAISPFTTTVNISQLTTTPSSWLTASGQAQIANPKLYPILPPVTNKSVGGIWMGCVEARISPPVGGYPSVTYYPAGMSTADAPPSGAGLFTPFLYPSTLQHSYTYGVPLNRGTTATSTAMLGTPPWNNQAVVAMQTPYPLADLERGDNDWYLNGTVPGWTGPSLFFGDNYNWNGQTDGNNGVGPNLGCPIPALPLTASQFTVQQTVNNMKATFRGGTMENLGLDAGWWLMSPNWTGLFNPTYTPSYLPHPYGQANKYIVLMTDGENQWYDWPVGLPGVGSNPTTAQIGSDADYTGYGRLGEGRSGTTNFNNTVPVLNTAMSGECAAMQAEGITIFTIIFPHGGGINSATQSLFKACATQPSYYFYAASNAELSTAFQTIANTINQLRLTWPGHP